MIWNRDYTLDEINQFSKKSMLGFLDIEFTSINSDSLEAQMPVAEKTKQPLGYLHGGASVVLAESVGSVAANLCVDSKKYAAFGLEINANHIKAVKSGIVKARAEAVHLGVTTQVWMINIKDEKENLVCTSRLTMAIRSK